MNYKESKLILEEIIKAKRILLSCHRSPDPDSIASNLSMYQVLIKLKKDVKVFSPDKIHTNFKFLPFVDKIQTVNYSNFDYSGFDLFIALDASSFDQVSGIKKIKLPNVPIIIIDHHFTNEKFGFINLLNIVSSTCEILLGVFKDWKIEIDKDLATCLLTGIYADSVSFQTDNSKASTFEVSLELIKLGADREKIILNLYNSNEFILIKFWGELLKNIVIDNEHKFVWTAVPYEIFSKYGKPGEAKSLAANLIFRSIKGTDFGIVMVEQRPKVLNMSYRSRTQFDVSKIAKKLGGSGHKASAGGWFEFENFDEAVNKVLQVARKFAKKG